MPGRAACIAAASILSMSVTSLRSLVVGARLVLVARLRIVGVAANLFRWRFLSHHRLRRVNAPACEVNELDQLVFMISLGQIVSHADQLRRHARLLTIASWPRVRKIACPAHASWAHNLLEYGNKVSIAMSPPGPRGARGIFCAGCAGIFSVSPGLPLDSRGRAFPARAPGHTVAGCLIFVSHVPLRSFT